MSERFGPTYEGVCDCGEVVLGDHDETADWFSEHTSLGHSVSRKPYVVADHALFGWGRLR